MKAKSTKSINNTDGSRQVSHGLLESCQQFGEITVIVSAGSEIIGRMPRADASRLRELKPTGALMTIYLSFLYWAVAAARIRQHDVFSHQGRPTRRRRAGKSAGVETASPVISRPVTGRTVGR